MKIVFISVKCLEEDLDIVLFESLLNKLTELINYCILNTYYFSLLRFLSVELHVMRRYTTAQVVMSKNHIFNLGVSSRVIIKLKRISNIFSEMN
jgi:hypothetical protein